MVAKKISETELGQLPNFKYFEEISKIPRMSFHEEKIADYLESYANRQGFWHHRDAIGNVIIKKPGTFGNEKGDPLILQAHTDMVCVKEPGSDHNFITDPIEVYLEDGWVRARGTTLGADDGAGVANILGLLSEPDLPHPPLECVFTVQEENGMGGARNLDFSLLKAKRMIGLDGIEEGTTIFSASAVYGMRVKKKITLSQDDFSEPFQYRLRVCGLTSGHGGLNIGSGRANAIKVAARILDYLNREIGIRLQWLEGGSLVHVIPGECEAIFSLEQAETAEKLNLLFHSLSQQIELEYRVADPGMTIRWEKMDKKVPRPLEKKCSNEIIELLNLLPTGPQKKQAEHPERVEASWNLSVLKMEEQTLSVGIICRSNYPSETGDLKNIIIQLAERFEGTWEETFQYAGHHVPEDSPLTQIWEEVYKSHTGKILERTYLHSALDAGTIAEGLGGLDLIVVMPTVLDVHTPRERMEAASFARTYQYLKDILARA
jgi:dipeptidase D